MDEQCAWVRAERKRHLRILTTVLCFGIILTACPKTPAALMVLAKEEMPSADMPKEVPEEPSVSGNTVEKDDDSEKIEEPEKTTGDGAGEAERITGNENDTGEPEESSDKDGDFEEAEIALENEKANGAKLTAEEALESISRAGEPEAVWTGTDGSLYAGSFRDAVANVPAGGMIGLLTDVSLDSTIVINKKIAITSYDTDKICTIKNISPDTDDGKETGRIFTVNGGPLQLSNVILDGGSKEGVTTYHPLVCVQNIGVILGPGAVLQNVDNRCQGLSGGAISIRWGQVAMYDGAVITSCKAKKGGGIEINSKGSPGRAILGMSGGSIEGCEAQNGGGIYVNIGQFQMYGGEISCNRATGEDSEDKTLRQGGGGIYINGPEQLKQAAVLIQNGKIAGNEAYNGGGILVQGVNATLEMQGGTIGGDTVEDGNEAQNGGGISVIKGTLRLFGGTVTGNTAGMYGGGVLGCPDGLIELKGAPKVYGNTANNASDRFDNLYLDGNRDSGEDVTLPIALTGALEDGVQLGLSRWIRPDAGQLPCWDMIVSAIDSSKSKGTYTMTEDDTNRLAQTLEEENKQLYADNMERYAFIPYKGKIVMILAVDVALDKETLFIEPGRTGTLLATVTPENTPVKDVTWSSSDETVATVDQNGVVTARGKGEAVITVTTKSPYHAEDTCKVKVDEYYKLTTRVEPGHGTITYKPDGPFTEGQEVWLEIVPEEGYQLQEGSVRAFKSGEESIEVEINENKLVMPDYDVTVEAVFEPITHRPADPETDRKPGTTGDEDKDTKEENGYREEESDDTPPGIPAKQEGKDTGHHSRRIKIEEKVHDTNITNIGSLNPQTGNNMPVWVMLALASALGLLFLGVFVFACRKILLYNRDLKDNEQELSQICDAAGIADTAEGGYSSYTAADTADEEAMQIDFAALQERNEDIRGWLICNGRIVNNPVVQAQDNSYYLYHSFMNRENHAGCIFMDYRNKSLDDKNVVIYGHNTTDRSMFGSLKDVLEDSFWEEEEHGRIYLVDTDNCVRVYQIFSYYVVENETYYTTTSFEDREAYESFLETIKRRSQRRCEATVTGGDKILTLSTCYGSAGTNNRLVIHAVAQEGDAPGQ